MSRRSDLFSDDFSFFCQLASFGSLQRNFPSLHLGLTGLPSFIFCSLHFPLSFSFFFLFFLFLLHLSLGQQELASSTS